jgi:SAM-dependent methyltransferase
VNFRDYYRRNVTYIERSDPRLTRIIDIVTDLQPATLLDLACGSGFLLDRLAERLPAQLTGVDVYDEPPGKPWHYRSADLTVGVPFEDGQFDVVVAGEIIEHVPHPDALLREIRRVLKPGGWLVLSTPNVVSWANRVLVPLGVQPLFTETSSEIHLGRRLRVLGQGNQVQGHLKVFTHRSLAEILDRTGYAVARRLGVPAEFPWPVSAVDRVFTRWVSLSSGLLYVARRLEHPRPPVAPRPYH